MSGSTGELALRIQMTRFAAFALSIALLACGAAPPVAPDTGARVLRPCPASPNCASTEATADMAPFRLAVPAESAWPRVREAVGELTRCHIADESESYLRAECASLLFRFVDDLEIELRASTGTLGVRSAARVGYSDLGVNRRRVERLRALLTERGVLQ